tara:strand:+ start:4522 stop:5280 length:759 start_codon:yes stop_codon:yes gene_type:complete
MKRKIYISGNWKMNPKTKDEAVYLANELKKIPISHSYGLIVFVPFPYIDLVQKILSETNIKVGAQDCYTISSGAYTGAVSVEMLYSVGCSYILAGHSERRNIFGDNNSVINTKIHAILNSELNCIFCIGENKQEYEKGLNKEICSKQLSAGLLNISGNQLENIIVAYEPVWAIGTGLTATPEIAEDVHKYIRSWFEKNYSKEIAENMSILYGGSVTPETVDALMRMNNIDGVLVGGASLVPEKFKRIINFKN